MIHFSGYKYFRISSAPSSSKVTAPLLPLVTFNRPGCTFVSSSMSSKLFLRCSDGFDSVGTTMFNFLLRVLVALGNSIISPEEGSFNIASALGRTWDELFSPAKAEGRAA